VGKLKLTPEVYLGTRQQSGALGTDQYVLEVEFGLVVDTHNFSRPVRPYLQTVSLTEVIGTPQPTFLK
jgi:hypothetical protein